MRRGQPLSSSHPPRVGPSHGLNIDSLPGTGTTVRMRIPKYRPGVHLS